MSALTTPAGCLPRLVIVVSMADESRLGHDGTLVPRPPPTPWVCTKRRSETIAEDASDHLDAPVARVAGADVPMRYLKVLEQVSFPHEAEIDDAVRGMLARV